MKPFMRKRKQLLRLVVLIPLVSFFIWTLDSCKDRSMKKTEEVTKEDVKTEIEEVADTAQAYFAVQKEEALTEYKNRIENAEKRISLLKQNMDSKKEIVRENLRQVIDSLEYQQAQAQLKLDVLKNSSEDAWKELTEGVEKAMNDLDRAIEDARNEYK